MPSNVQIESLVKAIMAILSSIAIAAGIGDEMTWAAVAGGASAVVILAWGYWANSKRRLVKDVAGLPDVHEIVAEPALANSIPSGKVIPARPEDDL